MKFTTTLTLLLITLISFSQENTKDKNARSILADKLFQMKSDNIKPDESKPYVNHFLIEKYSGNKIYSSRSTSNIEESGLRESFNLSNKHISNPSKMQELTLCGYTASELYKMVTDSLKLNSVKTNVDAFVSLNKNKNRYYVSFSAINSYNTDFHFILLNELIKYFGLKIKQKKRTQYKYFLNNISEVENKIDKDKSRVLNVMKLVTESTNSKFSIKGKGNITNIASSLEQLLNSKIIINCNKSQVYKFNIHLNSADGDWFEQLKDNGFVLMRIEKKSFKVYKN